MVNVNAVPDRPLQPHERQAMRQYMTQKLGDDPNDIPDDQLEERLHWGPRWKKVRTDGRCDFTKLKSKSDDEDDWGSYWHVCNKPAEFALQRPLSYYEPRESASKPENRFTGGLFDIKEFATVVLACAEHAGKRIDR